MGDFAVLSHDGDPAHRAAADLALLAVQGTGFGFTRQLASSTVTSQPPMLLVVDEPFEELMTAMWLGARGVVLASATDRELADCAALVARRSIVVSEEVLNDSRLTAGRRAFEWTINHDARAALEGLSVRELEVLKLVGSGRNNAEIAERLWLSSNTVRSHVRRLMQKLGMRSRLCLVVFALELGLVNLADVVLSSGSDDTTVPGARSAEQGPGQPAGRTGRGLVSHPVHAPDDGLQYRTW